MDVNELSSYIISICNKENLKKVFICGNGGAGKTTLSNKICEVASQFGRANLISLDDFLIDSDVRKSAKNKWDEDGVEYEYRFTSSNIESYFLKNVYELFYNIDNGCDCFYFPLRYKEKNNIRKLYSNYFLTVVEGVATAFLDIDRANCLTIYLSCSSENEKNRRLVRTKEFNRDTMELFDEYRSSQFRVNVLPKTLDFDIFVESDENFDLKIIKDIK